MTAVVNGMISDLLGHGHFLQDLDLVNNMSYFSVLVSFKT